MLSVALDGHALEVAVAVQLADLRAQADRDPWLALDLMDQVARHALSQVAAAQQHADAADAAGEEDRGLAGRGRSADDDDRALLAHLGLDLGGGVVHAGAFELVQPRDREPAVARAGREDHRARPQAILAL